MEVREEGDGFWQACSGCQEQRRRLRLHDGLPLQRGLRLSARWRLLRMWWSGREVGGNMPADFSDRLRWSSEGVNEDIVAYRILALRAQPQAREEAQPVAGLRPVVLAFAHLMEAKLKENDWKRGWKKDTALSLMARLREETNELDERVQARARFQVAINPPPAPRLHELIANEAADVANFAMMVADVCGGLPESAVRSIAEAASPPAPEAEKLRAEIELLEEVCARYADDEDAFLSNDGEPFGSITTECGMKARSARARFKARIAALQQEGR